jgi:glutamate racemase
MTTSQAPIIGVMDSGVGGLSVLREIHHRLPSHPTIYVADQAHVPYGPRPTAEIFAYVRAITAFLVEQGAQIIVIACHAACTASLYDLRAAYPHLPIVGIEPAVKPAAAATQSGVIGVLTTKATAEGALYHNVCQRFAQHVRVITEIAPEFVLIAESQDRDTPEHAEIIRRRLAPMLAAQADQIVLACTHFPFLAPSIQAIAGAGVTLVDPAPAVSRQVQRILGESSSPRTVPTAEHRYFTTGQPAHFATLLDRLIDVHSLVTHLPPSPFSER